MDRATERLSECDLILEGGVVSALAYLGFVERLSQRFRLRRLAGASSGALIAAAAAIAEMARRESAGGTNRAAFDGLARFAEELAATSPQGSTRLLELFRPGPGGEAAFALFLELTQTGARDSDRASPGRRARWLRLIGLLLRHHAGAALLGALPGLLALLWAIHSWPVAGAGQLVAGAAVVGACVATLGGAVLGLAIGFVRGTLRTLDAHFFGLTTGLSADQPGGRETDLAVQMHRLFNALVGRLPDGTPDPAVPRDKPVPPEQHRPVIFGELWGKAHAEQPLQNERSIDLQVITTSVSLSRPLRLPNDVGIDPLGDSFFDPVDWARLFPPPVLDWLLAHPRSAADGRDVRADDTGRSLVALPDPGYLPVMVAVRMSISFPGLLAAVPIYRLGPTLAPDAAGRVRAQRLWLSDGGVTCNLPVHLFDAPLPRRPTFAVDLEDLEEGDADASITVGARPRGPLSWDPGRLQRLAGFVFGLVNAARIWPGRLQAEHPGDRERIVRLPLRPQEQALHLSMSPPTILGLRERGREAAEVLLADFCSARTGGLAGPRANGWDRHRLVRVQRALGAFERWLVSYARADAALADATEGDHASLLAQGGDGDAAERARRLRLHERLLALARGHRAPASGLDDRNQPPPALRIDPPW